MSSGVRRSALAGVATAALLALPAAALANTYRPTRTDDPVPNGCKRHNCSLREAITKANDHAGHDTIVLRDGKTYELVRGNPGGVGEDLNQTGDLDVLGSLTIRSSNRKRATVDANRIDRVLDLGPTTTVGVSLKRLRVRGGSPPVVAGGGILLQNDSSLVLSRSVVSGNATNSYPGGGIWADDGTSLRLTRSIVSGNNNHGDAGGGMEVRGSVRISKSSITGNRGGEGAGIAAFQTERFTVTRSTIAMNRATGPGGVGGAVRFFGSPDSVGTFVNDTIASNHADNAAGGLFIGGTGRAALNAVTVARNSAGTDGGGIDIDDAATMRVDNSLVGLNTAAGIGPDCFADGIVVSGGYNLVRDPAEPVCADAFTQPGDITKINPGIKRLADNGGPTKTIALRKHSKAIDHAGSDAPKLDQRGVKRRVKGDRKPDIGAFERR